MNKIPVYRESVGNHCDNEIRPVKIVIPALAVPVAADSSG